MAVLLLLAAGMGAAQAAEFGRARTLSGVGQPLRVEIPLERPAEGESATTLVVRVSGGQAVDAGLTGREPLAVEATVHPRADGGLVAVLVSPEPVRLPVADLRLTLDSVRGTQQRRLILMLPPALQPGVSPISLTRATARTATDTLTVRAGNTAGAIAQRLRAQGGYPGATLYQVLAALLQANPAAFIDGNMNRIRAGARLTLPSADAARAIDAAEARRLYARHMADFAAYRSRTARGAGTLAAVPAQPQAQGGIATQAAPPTPPTGRDELRLSAASTAVGADAQQRIDQLLDERAATQRALTDAQSRVGELESTLSDMRRLLERQNETLARLQAQAGGAPGTSEAGQSAAAQGTVGPSSAGSQTAAGTTGNAGMAGAAGAAGLTGATGAAGATGAPGSTGSAGASGSAGSTGAAGTTGVAGPAGPAGAQGTPGATAPAGSPAAATPAGTTGAPGARATGAAVTNGATAGAASGAGQADAAAGSATHSKQADATGAGGGNATSAVTNASGAGAPGGSTAPAAGARTDAPNPAATPSASGTAGASDTVRAVSPGGAAAPGAAGTAPDARTAPVPGDTSAHWLDRYFWPVLVLSLAFIVAVLAVVFRRRRPPHEAEAVERPLPADLDAEASRSRNRPPHAP